MNEFLSGCNFEKTAIPFPAPHFSESYIIYPPGKIPPRKLYDNERIGIKPEETNRLVKFPSPEDRISMVLLLPVTFAHPDDIFVHKNLRAIDNNILMSHLKPWQCAGNDEFFKTPSFFSGMKSDGMRWLMENTGKLINDCSLHFDHETPKNKKLFSASRYDDKLLLEKLAWDGMQYRYGNRNTEAKKG